MALHDHSSLLEPSRESATETPYVFPRLRDCHFICLLYTSDAADERSSVDLGGRRIIKTKNNKTKKKNKKKSTNRQ